jgi:Kef-type K+ transport system membrane component KefB
MENYRKTLKKRLLMACVYIVLLLSLIVAGFFIGRKYAVSDFIAGFNTGVCMGVLAVMIVSIVKYIAALRNDAKLKALYIYENDERTKSLMAKAGGTGINVIIGSLALGTIVSGFIDKTVFLTILSSLLFSTFVKIFLMAYYNKKM